MHTFIPAIGWATEAGCLPSSRIKYLCVTSHYPESVLGPPSPQEHVPVQTHIHLIRFVSPLTLCARVPPSDTAHKGCIVTLKMELCCFLVSGALDSLAVAQMPWQHQHENCRSCLAVHLHPLSRAVAGEVLQGRRLGQQGRHAMKSLECYCLDT